MKFSLVGSRCIGFAACITAIELRSIAQVIEEQELCRFPYSFFSLVDYPFEPAVLALGTLGVLLCLFPCALFFTLLCPVTFTLLLSDIRMYSNHLYLLSIFSLMAALCYSHQKNEEPARDSYRFLFQWQLGLTYFFAALTKINAFYLSGGIVNAYWSDTSLLPLPDFLRTFEVFTCVALCSIVAECCLAFAVFLKRRLSMTLPLAFLFHVGLILTATSTQVLGVSAFSLLMMAGWLATREHYTQ